MPGSMTFQIPDVVRLAWGGLATTVTVTVTVYNADTGTVLLAATTLTSRGNGIYSYLWTHALTAKTWCVAQYSYPGIGAILAGTFTDYFTIDNLTTLQGNETGHAV